MPRSFHTVRSSSVSSRVPATRYLTRKCERTFTSTTELAIESSCAVPMSGIESTSTRTRSAVAYSYPKQNWSAVPFARCGMRCISHSCALLPANLAPRATKKMIALSHVVEAARYAAKIPKT
jgi:hypothetical protein